MTNNLETVSHFPITPINYSFYYNKMTAAQISYRDYLFKVAMTRDITETIENNTDRQIAANDYFNKLLQSTIIDEHIATRKTLYNNLQEINGTLITGFDGINQRVDGIAHDVREGFNGVTHQLAESFSIVSGQLQNVSQQVDKGFSEVSRKIGSMEVNMCLGFARLDSSLSQSSREICDRLDAINNILSNPRLTKARELYNMALTEYKKEFYEEALEDLQEAVSYHKTDYFSYYLISKIYLFGKNKNYDVVNLDKAIELLSKALRYIEKDAQSHAEAKDLASDLFYYLGYAHHNKAIEQSHKKEEYKSNLESAKVSYLKAWQYSKKMPEALYQRARCNVLLGNIQEAMQDLGTIMLIDKSYCIKAGLETDFNNVRKIIQKLFNIIKSKVFPKTKALHDKIKIIKKEFSGTYSPELTKYLKDYFPEIFTEELPIVDILQAREFFPEIIKLLEKEKIENNERKKQEINQEKIEKYREKGFIVRIEGDDVILEQCTLNIRYQAPKRTLVLPDDITIIEERVFENCHAITEIKLPECLRKIGEYAFLSCSGISEIVLPWSIKIIEKGAFVGCDKLFSVTIKSRITKIEDSVFSTCRNLGVVNIFTDTIKSIGEGAFEWSDELSFITIPSSVDYIGKGAFSLCRNLFEVDISRHTKYENDTFDPQVKFIYTD